MQLKFKERQIDLIHGWKEVNYKLWEHKVDLKTRKQYVKEVKGILLRLKNSLDNLTEEKVKKAEKALNEFLEEMESKGYWRVSNFFRKPHEKHSLVCLQKAWRNNNSMAQQSNGEEDGRDKQAYEEQVDEVEC